MLNGPILETKSGGSNDMVIHARIRTPNAQVGFGNVSNSANAQVLGGLIAAGIDMQASASATSFVIGSATQPAVTKTVITSTATDPANSTQSVTMQTVLDYRTNRTVTDAVTTAASTDISSATAAFSSKDVGRFVTGPGLTDGTQISSVTNPTTAVLSIAATSTGSGRNLVIKTPQVAVNSWRRV
jgi:hypothetical protein